MRTTLLILALACTAMLGCKKNEYTAPTNTNAMTYVINGLTDVTMDYKDTKTLPISIVRTAGTQEKLTLTVSGLPGRTTATFDVASGIPDFATTLTLATNYADGGSYDIKVTGTTASGVANSYSLKLKVNPEPALGCAEKLFGNYSAKYEGSYSNSSASVTAEGTGKKNEVRFKGFIPSDILGDIDCDNKEITIKSQLAVASSSGNTYVSGTGTYDDTHITLSLYLKNENGAQVGYYVCYLQR